MKAGGAEAEGPCTKGRRRDDQRTGGTAEQGIPSTHGGEDRKNRKTERISHLAEAEED